MNGRLIIVLALTSATMPFLLYAFFKDLTWRRTISAGLIAATLSLGIFTDGYEGLRIGLVVSLAGVALTLLYDYFANRQKRRKLSLAGGPSRYDFINWTKRALAKEGWEIRAGWAEIDFMALKVGVGRRNVVCLTDKSILTREMLRTIHNFVRVARAPVHVVIFNGAPENLVAAADQYDIILVAHRDVASLDKSPPPVRSLMLGGVKSAKDTNAAT